MKRELAREALLMLMNQLSDSNRERAGYVFEDMFLTWYFDKQALNDTYFVPYLDPTYGLCYRINSENATQGAGLVRSEYMGALFGLRTIVLVHVSY
jgi:hypothetical protein